MFKEAFTITTQDDRFHLLRSGEPVGSVMGYASRKDAEQAIDQIVRWDGFSR